MKPTIILSLAAVSALSLCSCKTPTARKKAEIEKKQVVQVNQIEKLKAEVEALEGRVKEMPPDRTDEIKALQTEAEAQIQEQQKIEAAISKLQARKTEVENEFAEYKRQHVTR